MAPSQAWHIDRLGLVNFRCFSHTEVPFEPDLTVLVGTNASGKTAILEALALMLSPVTQEFNGDGRALAASDARAVPVDLESRSAVARMDAVYPVEITASGTIAGEPIQWQRRRQRPKGRTSGGGELSRIAETLARDAAHSRAVEPVLPVIAMYGVERLLGVRRKSEKLSASRFGAYAAALDPRSDLSRLSSYLRDLSVSITNAQVFDDPPPTAAIAQFDAIARACDIVLEDTGWHRPRWNPVIDEITLSHPEHGTLPLSYLSSGIKITAGLVIDLASRMARANPALPAEDLLARCPGIVLVDEVDLHLHVHWQQKIVTALRTAFPRVQFVLTTHSPQVLSTVPASSIRVLHDNEVGRVAHASGLRADIILRTILDTDPEPDVEDRRILDEYVSLVQEGAGHTAKARDLRATIEQRMGGVNNVPELADADASMAFEELLSE